MAQSIQDGFKNNSIFMPYVLDFGNGFWKALTFEKKSMGNKVYSQVMRHSIAEIQESDWLAATNRSIKMNYKTGGVLKLGKKFYAVGPYADRFNGGNLHYGRDRYTKEYYRVGALAMLVSLMQEANVSDQYIRLYFAGSHAPRDVGFVGDMFASLSGVSQIETPDGRNQYVQFSKIATFDEPVGGLFNYLYNQDGSPDGRFRFRDGREIIVVDVGRLTTDFTVAVSVQEGDDWTFKIQHSESRSIELGLKDIHNFIANELVQQHPTKFGTTVDYDLVESVIKTGYTLSGRLDANNIRAMAFNTFFAKIKPAIREQFGSLLRYDVAVLTGGGGGVLMRDFEKVYSDMRFKKSAPLDIIHLSNAYGGKVILQDKITEWGMDY